MKNHLKRIATPRTWIINRKANTFITRPNPGAHAFENGMPLNIILRDILSLAATTREAKKLLNNKVVLVDGKRRKDHHFIVGLFDVISFPDLKKDYRVVMDNKGRLVVKEIPAEEKDLKICKIVGKTVLPKGKIQFNLHDGKNIISDKKAKVGDSFAVSLPSLEIKEVFPLQKSAIIFLQKGKHNGDQGVLKEIKGTQVLYEKEGQEIETAKDYLFVIGSKKAVITI